MNQIIPTREDIWRKNDQHEKLTPLERFILYYEPDPPSKYWRELLISAIEYEMEDF